MNAAPLARLLDPRELGAGDARRTFDRLTDPKVDDSERAALLVALTARGNRPDELVRLAREMRRRGRAFRVPSRDRAIDLCGSGGARVPSFNVSTVSAFVVRASGVRVAKHGNRSRRICGSSDLLEALGLPVTTSAAFARATYRKKGIAFLHAPLFHPAMASLGPVRARLGIPTAFNRLGPLTSPARVRCQVMGTPDRAAVAAAPAILRALGVTRGIAMTSDDGCDEFSPAAPTSMAIWNGGRVRHHRVDPRRLLDREDRRGPWGALPAATAAEEAERILAGGGGARRGAVLLTSGAALWAHGSVPNLASGVERAREALDSGAAEDLLGGLRELAPRYARVRGG
jgi:anthranilate phosphoribosyltransferase